MKKNKSTLSKHLTKSKIMNRIEKFRKLINTLDEQRRNEEFKYIGTGNPNADILIIGKETSINKVDADQYKREMLNNFHDWKTMSIYNPSEVKNYFENGDYSPLYPYKGQIFNIDNGKNKGTSRTWYNYQKLYNLICYKPDNSNIDFHENIFITEVNSTPSRRTKDANTSSICERKDTLLKSEFINDFPIVIISGVGYFEISETRNETEEIFNVKFKTKEIADEREKQPYWIHWSEDGSKLLINTYQLSIGISDNLLSEIAEVIRKSNLLQFLKSK